MERICVTCKIPKDLDQFHSRKRSDRGDAIYHSLQCKKCLRKRRGPKKRQYARENTHNKRIRLFNHYSNGNPKCACCQENRIEILQLDHIHGGGNKHKREITAALGSRLTSSTYYSWIIRNNFPPIFRLLCPNCNLAIHILGYCPHHPPTSIPPRRPDLKGRFKRKLMVLNHYCNGDIKCAKCGEREYTFLQIDHIDDNGGEHRKIIGSRSADALRVWIIKNNFPPGFQILCANCNHKKLKAFIQSSILIESLSVPLIL